MPSYDYESMQAVIFIVLAIAFASVMAYVAWRVIRNVEDDDPR